MYNDLYSALGTINNLNSSGNNLKSEILNILNNTSVYADGDITILYGGYIDGVSTSSIVFQWLCCTKI